MRFRFLAESADGDIVRGELASESRSAAARELEDNGLKVQLLQFHECGGRKSNSKRRFRVPFSSGKMPATGKYELFEQLSMLLSSGLSIEQSLSIFDAGEERDASNGKIVRFLGEKIAIGMSLSEAMACCRQVFSQTEIKTLRAAEKIGRPDIALQELADFGKKLSSVKGKIKSALTYPAIVLVVSCIALGVLMAVVVPKFEVIFRAQVGDGGRLPWLTQMVLNTCNFFIGHFVAIFIFIAAVVVTVRICFSRRLLVEKLSALGSKLPIFGELLLSINLGNFFRAAGMLMSFGVPIQDALELSMGVVDNIFLRRSLGRVLGKIAHGENLVGSFRGSKFLSSTDCGLILAGEQSGGLAKSFSRIAEIYGQKINRQLVFLATLAEPAIILFLAVVVGIIVIAVFLPMISVMQSIRI
ncbi:MAG: type II secretion system F family protein [Puniceicoccales bacterium]|jgi:type IV pilus assembly protein PilC|nr:type II secretion system F family protein [Puniceicoccales bacterium]